MSKPPYRGFTLVETLVATAVLSLMMVLLGQVLSHVSKSWIFEEGGAQHRRSIRALADYIGDELPQALLPLTAPSNNTTANLQFLLNPVHISPSYRYADALFWQAPLATESSYGDIAIIGYFVQWVGDRPYLCRLFINPSLANEDISQNPNYLLYQSADPKTWLSNTLLDELVTPDNKANGYRGLFAENVTGFWVRCYGQDGNELPKSYDSRNGYSVETQTAIGTTVTETRHLPAVVEISLALVDGHHSARLGQAKTALVGLTSSPDIDDAKTFMKRLENDAQTNPSLAAILPGTRIYTKRIELQCVK